jgi:serine/threonine-protein kinase
MGQVWLATEIRAGMEIRQVVCKIVFRSVQNDPAALEKVLQQFQLTRDLVHQNICPVYGLESDPVHGLFFVMAYADGGTLWNWFSDPPNSQRPRTIPEVVEVLAPIASALDFAHQVGVIHRDVKPQNIMFESLNGHRVLWLIDFGISVRLHETKTATQGQYSASGTPYYMAPEQWEEEMQDERTDQYALAAIAYHFLAGRPPFEAKNHFAIGHKALSTPVRMIEWLSPEQNMVLCKGLAKRKEDRFSTCSEFIEALKTSAQAQPQPQWQTDPQAQWQTGPQSQSRVEIWSDSPVNLNSSIHTNSFSQTDVQSQTDFVTVSVSSENGRSSVSTHFSSKSKPKKAKDWKDMSQKEKAQTKAGCGCLLVMFLLFVIFCLT